jgi:hypothetical protein
LNGGVLQSEAEGLEFVDGHRVPPIGGHIPRHSPSAIRGALDAIMIAVVSASCFAHDSEKDPKRFDWNR